MQRKKKVVILGGGIGGLTVAHYLSYLPNTYDIEVYERNFEVGGLARSGRDRQGCATEYCWRVFFGFYRHFFHVLNSIPLSNQIPQLSDPGIHIQTCMSNLVPYRNTTVSDSPLPFQDWIVFLYWLLYGFTSCDYRLNACDRWKWSDVLRHTSSSHILRQVGPWLGMDREKASYKSVIKVGFEWNVLRHEENYVTNQPTSEAIFVPWQKELENRKVKFFLNHEVKEIYPNKNVWIRNLQENKNKFLEEVDLLILALPIEVLASISQNKWFVTNRQQINIQTLAKTCLHMQTALQVYFTCPVWLGVQTRHPTSKAVKGEPNTYKNNSILITDSPWDLIILQYDQAYNLQQTSLCKGIGATVKGGWSIAICTAYTKGIKITKTFRECSESEIQEEIWAQMQHSKGFDRLVQQHNGFTLAELRDRIVHWSPLWPDFERKANTIQMKEPKFTNNAGSWAIRPSFRTLDKQVWISTAYVKETIDIFSMEAACLAGTKVASAITGLDFVHSEVPRSWIFTGFRALDCISFVLGGPNLFLLWILLVVIGFIYYYFM